MASDSSSNGKNFPFVERLEAMKQLGRSDIRPDTPVQKAFHRVAAARGDRPGRSRWEHACSALDEPTSSLARNDIERAFFELVSPAQKQGLGIVHISHRKRCCALCDRFTVLRDGKSVGTAEVALRRMKRSSRPMVGPLCRRIFTPRSERTQGEKPFWNWLNEIAGPSQSPSLHP